MNVRTKLLRLARRLGRSERGTQLVELAIVLPVLLLFFAATAEFGRYFYTYTTLAKATRSGARYLASTLTKAGNTTGEAAAQRLVVYGDPNAADNSKPLITGLTTGNVKISRGDYTGSIPGKVTVEIQNYNYTPLINLGKLTKGTGWFDVPLKPSTSMRYLISQPSI